MAAHWTNDFSYVTGAVRRKDVVYLARASDEMNRSGMEHTFATVWHAGNWIIGDGKVRHWATVGVAVAKRPLEQGLILGLWGEVHCLGSGDIHDEKIRAGLSDSPEVRGPLRAIRTVGEVVFAVGTRRQAYRRDGRDSWSCIDAGAYQSEEGQGVASFEAIDGFRESELWAAGRRGEIWHYDGKRWAQSHSPTNQVLTGVCCAGDGNIYVCGRAGMLARGRPDQWEIIDQGSTDDDFWSVVWYREALFLSTMRRIYRLAGGNLEPVDFGRDVPGTCFHLSVADDTLLSVGAKDVMAFDGSQWTRID